MPITSADQNFDIELNNLIDRIDYLDRDLKIHIFFATKAVIDGGSMSEPFFRGIGIDINNPVDGLFLPKDDYKIIYTFIIIFVDPLFLLPNPHYGIEVSIDRTTGWVKRTDYVKSIE